MTDYARFYDLQRYLFGEVSGSFKQNKTLSAFDFFCITRHGADWRAVHEI